MASWNPETQQVTTEPDAPWAGSPGWTLVDCHCCCGLQWGGWEPRECPDCGGSGFYARHEKTGTLALYPGGPFIGREVRKVA